MYNQQRAEDVFLWNCYMYYVLAHPRMSDHEFDLMHAYFKAQFPTSYILHNFVGADNPDAYPRYIQEHRRPQLYELRTR